MFVYSIFKYEASSFKLKNAFQTGNYLIYNIGNNVEKTSLTRHIKTEDFQKLSERKFFVCFLQEKHILEVLFCLFFLTLLILIQ